MTTLKRTIVAILILLLIGAKAIAETVPDKVPPQKIKVALVLCGGGAKGVAHIGVIKKLEEVGIQPDIIVGTSMGALVGGLYAMGYNSAQMDTIVSTADWSYLLSDNIRREDLNFSKKQDGEKFFLNIPIYMFRSKIFRNQEGNQESDQEKPQSKDKFTFNLPGGFVSGNNVLNLLNGLAMGYQDSIDFNTLPIPFACIATDLATGEEVVLDHGTLPLCMRASMAIPGFFAPVTIDGRVLVDGGVVNNFPVDVAKKMGADIIIGVDVQTALSSADELKSIDAVLMQLIGLMGNDRFLENKQQVDIYMHPDVSKFGTMSFNKEAVEMLLANGYKAAEEREELLIALAKLIGENKTYSSAHRASNVYKARFRVGKITFEGVEPQDRRWLMDLAGLKENQVMSGAQINNAISVFTGTQVFAQVTYSLTKSESEDFSALQEYDLNFKFTKGPSDYISIGARYDTEEAAAMIMRVGINQYSLHGSRASLTARLSFNPYIKLEYDYMFRNFPRLELSYLFGKRDVNIYSDKVSRNNIAYIYNGVEAALANITYFRDLDVKIGVRLENFKFTKFYTNVEEHKLERTNARSYLPIFACGVIDTRDSKYFPEKGMYIKADAAYYLFGFHSGFKSFGSYMINANMAFNLGRGFVVEPRIFGRVNVRNRLELPFYNYVGGSEAGRYVEHQMPFIGINYANAMDNSVAILRTDIRKKLRDKHYVYLLVNYLRNGKSLDKMVSFDQKGYWGIGAQYSYQTRIGPLSFNVHWSDYSKKKVGAYLSLGYFF